MSKFEDILVDSSRAVADLVVSEVGRDPVKMLELYQLAVERKGQLAMRAARAFDLVDEAEPGMGKPYLSEIRNNIASIKHDSVLRCFMRTLSRYPLPEDDEELGRFYQFMVDRILDQSKAVAIRYYGMHFAYETNKLLPDLRFELIPILDNVMKEDLRNLAYRAKVFKRELITKYGAE